MLPPGRLDHVRRPGGLPRTECGPDPGRALDHGQPRRDAVDDAEVRQGRVPGVPHRQGHPDAAEVSPGDRVRDNTFYALLCLRWGEQTKEIDSRPSDALAVALRTDSPIWVMEEVVADASIPVDRDADEEDQKAFKEFVSHLRPEDFIRGGSSSSSES